MTKRLDVRLEDDTWAALAEIAALHERSINAEIGYLLRYALGAYGHSSAVLRRTRKVRKAG